MNKREFILNTLLPYRENPNLRASDKYGVCSYLTKDGKKCAIGKHMLNGEWQHFEGSPDSLLRTYDPRQIFTKEFLEQDFSIIEMEAVQIVHDSNFSKDSIDRLERITFLSFPEIYS